MNNRTHTARPSFYLTGFLVFFVAATSIGSSSASEREPVYFSQDQWKWGETIPSDYVNPYRRIIEHGTIIAEAEVNIEAARFSGPPWDWTYQLRNVLEFIPPSWAGAFMIVFEPSETMSLGPVPGLYLRPGSPFVEGGFLFEGMALAGGSFPKGWLGAMERHAHPQAAYRSEGYARGDQPGLPGTPNPQHPLFIYVDSFMDPPVSNEPWHVAMGHRSTPGHNITAEFRAFDSIEGHIRVYAHPTQAHTPLAVKLFYPSAEFDDRTGLFDDTPRVPAGNNPGTTLGEARRWVVREAAASLMEELDFRGQLPIALQVTFSGDRRFGMYTAGSGTSRLRGVRHLPGRLANEGLVLSPTRIERGYVLSAVINRESGTLPSLISASSRVELSERWLVPGGRLSFPPDNTFPPQVLDWPARINFVDDTTPAADFTWNLDRPGSQSSAGPGPSLWYAVKAGLTESLGEVFVSLPSLTYASDFEPPRHFNDNPDIFTDPEGWHSNPHQYRFYGPHVAQSAYNPWRDLDDPGVRIRSDSAGRLRVRGHCDDKACWDDVPGRGGAFGQGIISLDPVPGIAEDMLADLGLADDFRAFRDHRLPRHWYDPTRSGHGIDFRRVVFADGNMAHFAHFYTYDQAGNPEWFMAIGEMEDRTFSAALEYYTFDEARNPPQQADPSRQGWLSMDFDPAHDHPTCKEARRHGDAHPSPSIVYAVVDWELDGESGSWCMEPLRFGDLPGMPEDVTGSWLASDGEDVGWGFSLLHRNFGPRPIINAVLYYYDAQGNPVWASGVVGGGYDLLPQAVMEGVELEMLHIDGFCRSCEPGPLNLRNAGHMKIRLSTPSFGSDSGNWIESLDVQNLGPGGGRWQRSNIGVSLLSSPNPSMDP